MTTERISQYPFEHERLSELGEAAIELARGGFRLFPIKARSKTPPLLKGWPEKATSDPERVARWWARWPQANIGLATGQGIAVVDGDVGHGAPASPEALGFPATLTATTPTGGWHAFYAVDRAVKNSTSRVAQGVDVRGEQGYVVAAPSIRAEGAYEWADVRPMGRLDARRLEPHRKTQARGRFGTVPGGDVFEPRERVGPGERHDELTRWGGFLRASGYEADEIAEWLYEVNATFHPPLDDPAEIERVATWAGGLPQ